ncbi:MAG: mannose-6-phosphate isomerase, class I, partial [Microbacteriaceae bacterium]|nr:mannose-6-phosphate isomerase, class I [Microbacteriaceae bacterium]
RGDLEVRAPLVAGRVERAIVSGLEEYLVAEAPAVDAWIAGLADIDERIAVADDAARPGLEQVARLRENVARIRVAHPDDTGVLTVLLMNHLRLERGEAAYVRAGVLHAYLDGLGIEVMAASDNVLRGGLTEKHVDVDELLAVLDCTPGDEPRMAPVPAGEGVVLYAPDEPDFRLHRVAAERADARIALVGPGIALGLRGEATLVGALGEEAVLRRGEALYITPDTGELRVSGDGLDLVIASAGAPADVVLPH